MRAVAWVIPLAFLALILTGAARLRFDVEVLNLLPDKAPEVQGLKLYQQNFSNAAELILTIRATAPELAEETARRMAESLRLETNLVADASWQAPWVERPAQAAELAAYIWFNQPPSVFGTLTNRLLPHGAAERLAETRQRLTSSLSPHELARLSQDPFDLLTPPTSTKASGVFQSHEDLFASPDGRFRLVFVRAARDLRTYPACHAWLESMAQSIASARVEHAIPPEVQIRWTGRPAFVSEIAGGMERDISSSILGTLFIVACLFWWAHRSWRPLLWLLVLLAVILATTLALGGLLLGTLNVVSAGFAAILVGLAVDYALVLFQEHRAAPALTAPQVQRAVRRSIGWSAATTAGAFLLLNFGGLPGLAQLGTLVALGIGIAAVTMLYAFLPPLLHSSEGATAAGPRRGHWTPPHLRSRATVSAATALLIVLSAVVIWFKPPVIDHSPDPLRPSQSAAYSALNEIRSELKQEKEPYWLLIAGEDEAEVANRLAQVQPRLERAQASGAIESLTLPGDLWPRPQFQRENQAVALQLLQGRDQARQIALNTGFAPSSLASTESMWATWEQAMNSRTVYWPTNELSRWVLSKFSAHSGTQWLALGFIYPGTNSVSAASAGGQLRWTDDLQMPGVWVAGWSLLGEAVLQVVQREFWRVLIPMALLLVLSLWLTFRRWTEIALSFGLLLLSTMVLLGVMAVAGWSWNLLNLMAVPLLLGAGVDYSIHMQLALRRHGGDLAAAQRGVGRALLLCAGTTATGFGSLAWSSNAGLASLGAVCATGVIGTFALATGLLPGWWHNLAGSRDSAAVAAAGPSSLYRTELWRMGHWMATRMPRGAAGLLCKLLGGLYWRFNARRRHIVIENLLPVVDGDRRRAERLSAELFQQFARKILDLWQSECGRPVQDLVCDPQGWDHFAAATESRRGVLLLTPHLGNWELGAPLLADRGHRLTVITLQEPDATLTELRKESRARWGVETLVIGENPFAFVDVIRRLNAGATVALLMDRPPPPSSTTVKLFGRPFPASVAAAELARASGCVLLPVYLPRTAGGYRAEVLPEIPYDRAALGSRPAREELTQKIMDVFAPVIRQYASQWYHFVPIWTAPDQPAKRDE
jgi:uncharacterized protein